MKKWNLAAASLVFACCASPSIAQTSAAPTTPDIDITGPAIRVTDLDRSLKFYVDGLGLVVLQRMTEGKALVVLLAPKGRTMPPIVDLLQSDPDPAKSAPVELGNGFDRIILSVADSKATYARLKSAGYAPRGNGENGNFQGGNFQVKDPDGYHIEITQRRAAATQK